MYKAIDMTKAEFNTPNAEYLVINSVCESYEIECLDKGKWLAKNRTAFFKGSKVFTDFDSMKRFIIAN